MKVFFVCPRNTYSLMHYTRIPKKHSNIFLNIQLTQMYHKQTFKFRSELQRLLFWKQTKKQGYNSYL